MVKSHSRGHEIVCNDGKSWIYADTGQPVSDNRPCAKCGRKPLPTGEDACLGHIEGAKHACCGHGVAEGYIIK